MTKKKIKVRDHADHNYKAYTKLKELNEFNDWVVTTSFYSSIKYLEHKLFPGEFICPVEGNMKKFHDFPQYVNACKSVRRFTNPHKLLDDAIYRYIDDSVIYNSYIDLKNACYTARYINYRVGNERVKMCEEAIETIKDFCIS